MRFKVIATISIVVLAALALGVLVHEAQLSSVRPPRTSVTIHGNIMGPALHIHGNGAPLVAVSATVACNDVAVMARANGAFSLRVRPAHDYRCLVTPPPQYEPHSVTIPDHGHDDIELDFGVSWGDLSCAPPSGGNVVECPPLNVRSASLSGRVTDSSGQRAVAGALIHCAYLEDGPRSRVGGVLLTYIQTDQHGAYSEGSLAAGTYTCFVTSTSAEAAPQQVVIRPGGTYVLDFRLCTASCPALRYHLGPVMHTFTAYLIFWLPNGSVFEPGPGGDDRRYEELMARYFQDMGGTPFYGLLTQYWDYAGSVRNAVTLGGVYHDSAAYVHCNADGADCAQVAADRAHPLLDNDIQAETSRALHANPGWTQTADSEFFVFTGYGAEECSSTAANAECSFKTGKQGFCAYHSGVDDNPGGQGDAPMIYAYIPDAANDHGLCTGLDPGFRSPTGDTQADSTLSFVSHEQFESVTNPFPGRADSWFDDHADPHENEIGDKCETVFGEIGADGGNVTLALGHRYLLQAEWSNRANACAFR